MKRWKVCVTYILAQSIYHFDVPLRSPLSWRQPRMTIPNEKKREKKWRNHNFWSWLWTSKQVWVANYPWKHIPVHWMKKKKLKNKSFRTKLLFVLVYMFHWRCSSLCRHVIYIIYCNRIKCAWLFTVKLCHNTSGPFCGLLHLPQINRCVWEVWECVIVYGISEFCEMSEKYFCQLSPEHFSAGIHTTHSIIYMYEAEINCCFLYSFFL